MSDAQSNQKAWGHGLASKSPSGTVLDVWFPEPCLGEAPMSDLQWFPPKDLDLKAGPDELRNLTLEVIRVDKKRNLILIKGAVPGSKGSDVMIRPAVKAKVGA